MGLLSFLWVQRPLQAQFYLQTQQKYALFILPFLSWISRKYNDFNDQMSGNECEKCINLNTQMIYGKKKECSTKGGLIYFGLILALIRLSKHACNYKESFLQVQRSNTKEFSMHCVSFFKTKVSVEFRKELFLVCGTKFS